MSVLNNIKRYPPSLFSSKNQAQAFNVAKMAKFASIHLTHEPEMDILFAPFYTLYDKNQEARFYGHLVRSNPLFNYLKEKGEVPVRLLFNEVDIYISPTAYAQKQLTHNVVPTWNYVAVQFQGVMSMTPEEQLINILQKQVEIFEEAVESKWRLSDSSPQYINSLQKSIFGVKIEVLDWKVHKKLSQNKDTQEFNNVKIWSDKLSKKEMTIVDWMNHYEKKT